MVLKVIEMERQKYLELAIFVLAFALVITLVTQPLVEQEASTTSFVIGGEAEVEAPFILSAGLVGDFYEPATWNGTACYWAYMNYTDTDIVYYNETGNHNITFTPTVEEYDIHCYREYVLWIQDDGVDSDVFIKNITTNWTSQLTFTSEPEFQPCMWGSNVIFVRYNTTTGYDIIWLNLNNMTETIIAGESEYEIFPDIYNNTVVYVVASEGCWLNMVDLDNASTFSDPFLITEDCQYEPPSIWGDYVVFAGERDGFDVVLLYHIENHVEYELTPRSNDIDGHYPIVWQELVVFHIEEAGNVNFAIITLETDLFDEHYIQITNDTQDKHLWDFHDSLIVYDGEDLDTGDYDAYAMEIIDVTTGEIDQDIGEIETVYNQDWIYFTIIMIVGLIALVLIYYSEFMKEN